MKKVIGMIFIIIISLVILTGCTSSEETEKRFIQIYTNDYKELFYDKKTKVVYMYYDGYYGGGLTVMLDTEGKPLLYEGE